MNRFYFVFVKDSLLHKFWTVHAEANNLKDAFEYAKMKTYGGDAFGVRDCGCVAPEDFCHGTVEENLKGV
jgi:hypothetical protein